MPTASSQAGGASPVVAEIHWTQVDVRDEEAINCLPTLLLGKYARLALEDSTYGVFATVSARVGSIEDYNLGGWYSYRASKAALNMVLKCLSIEWGRNAKCIRVVSLHPGTTLEQCSDWKYGAP